MDDLDTEYTAGNGHMTLWTLGALTLQVAGNRLGKEDTLYIITIYINVDYLHKYSVKPHVFYQTQGVAV